MPLKRRVGSKTRMDDWEPGEVREFRWLHPSLPPPEGFVENDEPRTSHHHAYGRMVIRRETDES